MAFSYSDENFTVIGNLCFVHIFVEGALVSYAIPPAIADRMLIKQFIFPYLSYDHYNHYVTNAEPAMVYVDQGIINIIANYTKGYVIFYFPIDSNK